MAQNPILTRWLLLLVMALSLLSPAAARAKADPFDQRAQDLLLVLQQEAKPEPLFSPSFLAQIPGEQITAIARKLREQNGDPQALGAISRQTADSGSVEVIYRDSVVHFDMALEANAPFRVIGLLAKSVSPRNDSNAKLRDDFSKLAGSAGVVVTPLGKADTLPMLAINADQQFAVASSFKLWLLAEASRQVRSGKRKWSDVIPLTDPSLPSGMTQNWPKRAPMTLHSLATFAISISDNTAADTMLYALGRRDVNAMLGRAGHSRPVLPVLGTLEAFALKMDGAADLRAAWRKSGSESRLAMLGSNPLRLGMGAIDDRQLAGRPRYIAEIEWFAAPADMARLLDWIRLNADQDAMAILAVNKGIAKGDAARFRYIGYKGGSEIGVVAMNFLVQSRDGSWYAVCGAWNNPAAAVDEARFLGLMNRALALIGG
jgi:beta-lactamase class A